MEDLHKYANDQQQVFSAFFSLPSTLLVFLSSYLPTSLTITFLNNRQKTTTLISDAHHRRAPFLPFFPFSLTFSLPADLSFILTLQMNVETGRGGCGGETALSSTVLRQPPHALSPLLAEFIKRAELKSRMF